jgi:hypothetical protein
MKHDKFLQKSVVVDVPDPIVLVEFSADRSILKPSSLVQVWCYIPWGCPLNPPSILKRSVFLISNGYVS